MLCLRFCWSPREGDLFDSESASISGHCLLADLAANCTSEKILKGILFVQKSNSDSRYQRGTPGSVAKELTDKYTYICPMNIHLFTCEYLCEKEDMCTG